MREDRLSTHRFRWLAGLLLAVIGLLLWQNMTLRAELRNLHNHVEEAVATAEDAAEYARQAKMNTEVTEPKSSHQVKLTEPHAPASEYHSHGALMYVGPPILGRPQR